MVDRPGISEYISATTESEASVQCVRSPRLRVRKDTVQCVVEIRPKINRVFQSHTEPE